MVVRINSESKTLVQTYDFMNTILLKDNLLNLRPNLAPINSAFLHHTFYMKASHTIGYERATGQNNFMHDMGIRIKICFTIRKGRKFSENGNRNDSQFIHNIGESEKLTKQ